MCSSNSASIMMNGSVLLIFQILADRKHVLPGPLEVTGEYISVSVREESRESVNLGRKAGRGIRSGLIGGPRTGPIGGEQ